MDKKGLIYPKRDEGDTRIVRIFLTEEGVAKRKLAKQTILNFNEKLMQKLNNKDFEHMIKVFDIIKQSVVDETGESNIHEFDG